MPDKAPSSDDLILKQIIHIFTVILIKLEINVICVPDKDYILMFYRKSSQFMNLFFSSYTSYTILDHSYCKLAHLSS